MSLQFGPLAVENIRIDIREQGGMEETSIRVFALAESASGAQILNYGSLFEIVSYLKALYALVFIREVI